MPHALEPNMQKLVCCIISIDKLFSENGNVLVVWVTCALAISRYLGSKRKKIILNFGNSNLVAWLSLRTNKLRSSSPIAFVSEGIKNFLNTLTVWSAVVYRIRPVTWCGIFEKFCARTSAEAVWGFIINFMICSISQTYRSVFLLISNSTAVIIVTCIV